MGGEQALADDVATVIETVLRQVIPDVGRAGILVNDAARTDREHRARLFVE